MQNPVSLFEQKKCTVLEFPDMPMKLESYFDLTAVSITLGAIAFEFLLAFIPVKTKILTNGAKARGNGEQLQPV